MSVKNDYQSVVQLHTRQLPIIAKSLLVGVFSAIIIILYRLGLTKADDLRSYFLAIVQDSYLILVYFAGLVGLSLLTYFLVKRYPLISGSGIPQVKGQIRGVLPSPWKSTLIAKFFGGLLTGLAGLSLGREGPSIQLGASAAHSVADILSTTQTERKILIASGAAAGLAAAFNAPLAGVIFAFEEIFKYISPITLLSTITAAVSADFLSKLVFGMTPVFAFGQIQALPLSEYYLVILLGIITGFGGVIYNRTVLGSIRLYRIIGKLHPCLKFLIPFVVAGILGLTFPVVLGGGHPIVEQINLSTGLQWLLVALVLKFAFSMLSFGSGAPGGIFFPLLVIGALIGAIFNLTAAGLVGSSSDLMATFMILAMAGYFSAIVRAPITGIVLLTEMTGSFSHMLALTLISVTAYVTAELLRSEPIYDALLANLLKTNSLERPERDQYRKTTFETIVHHGSPMENRHVSELTLPKGCLIIALRRDGLDVTPTGGTLIQAEDHLIVLTNIKDEAMVREAIEMLSVHTGI